jgi:hypothetical protein
LPQKSEEQTFHSEANGIGPLGVQGSMFKVQGGDGSLNVEPVTLEPRRRRVFAMPGLSLAHAAPSPSSSREVSLKFFSPLFAAKLLCF